MQLKAHLAADVAANVRGTKAGAWALSSLCCLVLLAASVEVDTGRVLLAVVGDDSMKEWRDQRVASQASVLQAGARWCICG